MATTKSRAIDVTEGPIGLQLLQLAWPIVLSGLFQQAYMLVNVYVVGQFSTKEVLGGIQATTSLCEMLLNFCIGIGAGCAVMAGQFFGAKHNESLSRSVHTAYALAIVMGVITTVLGLVFIRPILVWMDTPAELLADALMYGRWYFATMIFWLAENITGALLRAVGDTRTPTIVVGVSCLLNAFLDVIFVGYLGMDALGIGVATFLSVGFAAVGMTWSLMRVQGAWKLRLRDVRLHRDLVGEMLKIGLPLGFQSASYSISNLTVQISMNSLGADVVTAWGLQGRITNMSWLIIESFGLAVMTFSAQNFGARNIKRMRRGLRVALGLTVSAALLIALVLYVYIEPITALFISDSLIIELCVHMTRVLCVYLFLYAVVDVISGLIRGAGESLRPMIIIFVGTCVFRVLWLMLVFPPTQSLDFVLVSYPISWGLTALIFIFYYHFGHWLNHAADREAEILG